MRVPRFRIASLMVLVVITALSLWAIRRFSNHPAPDKVLLGLGILPMASFLAIGLLICCRRRGNRRFLWGFEAFGVVAVALYIAATIRFPRELVLPYLSLAPVPTRTTPGVNWTTTRMLMTYSILSLWVSLPQMVFAVISGFLFRNFRPPLLVRSFGPVEQRCDEPRRIG